MTDKEMIEEMARVLHDKIVDKTWRAEKVAEELYKIAVPEGSVVLSREEKQEYEGLVKLLIYDKPIKSRVYEFIKETKEQARKETAREIFAWLKEHCDYVGFSIIEAYFKETFGVDIKE